MNTKIEFTFGLLYAGDGSVLGGSETAIGLVDIESTALKLFGGFTMIDVRGGWHDTDRGVNVIEPGKNLIIYADDNTLDAHKVVAMASVIKTALRQKSVVVCLTDVTCSIC